MQKHWLRAAVPLSRPGFGLSLSIHTLFQLLEPVLDDDHAGRRCVRIAGCAVFEHQEPLAVRRHVVMSAGEMASAYLASNTFAGLPALNVDPDVWTGTAVSVFDASR